MLLQSRPYIQQIRPKTKVALNAYPPTSHAGYIGRAMNMLAMIHSSVPDTGVFVCSNAPAYNRETSKILNLGTARGFLRFDGNLFTHRGKNDNV